MRSVESFLGEVTAAREDGNAINLRRLNDTYRHCELGAAGEVWWLEAFKVLRWVALLARLSSGGVAMACLRLQHPPESSMDCLQCMDALEMERKRRHSSLE